MSGLLRLSVYELSAVSGIGINATAFIIYACVNLLPARAKYPEYKSKICAKGVFRSQTLSNALKRRGLAKELHYGVCTTHFNMKLSCKIPAPFPKISS